MELERGPLPGINETWSGDDLWDFIATTYRNIADEYDMPLRTRHKLWDRADELDLRRGVA